MSQAAEKTAAELLATPVQFLKGVGPERAELLTRLGLKTARDVLFFFPRDYQDLTDLRPVAQLEEDKLLSVHGTVEEIDMRNTGTGRSMVGVLVRQGNDFLRALWFNQPFMRDKFRRGQQVLLSGKAKLAGLRWEMVHPRVQHIDDEASAEGKILPVYPLTEGLNQQQVRRIVEGVLESYLDVIEEVFPPEYLLQHKLLPIAKALPQVHFPQNRASLTEARRRFVYQELLIMQLALALKRQSLQQSGRSPALEASPRIDERIRKLFPFTFTTAQNQVIAEITNDIARSVPMNRLLQGDVGSGKTVVAVYALLTAVAHGYQAVLMAPTEVLARQHAQTFEKLLATGRVRCGVLTGSLTAAQRQELLAKIKAHEIDLVIGTQAIVQPGVEFPKLGLVVIDEQHKFGVRQRATLKDAGEQPHYLVMTATPIPRTVALAIYGDLDVSTLRESPPGRQTVHTYLAKDDERSKWWDFFRKKLSEGRQGYVVTPLVEDNDSFQLASLDAAYEELVNGELEAFRLGLLHGRMSAAGKDAAMQAFRRGETQVLVTTSVIEVGVDIPNATLMTIEDGHRFGLAQLHQLRGRISRGSHPGYCCVFAQPESEDAQQRLEAFIRSTDGFELAERDFQLRGPGDLLGTRQHGLPPLRIADLQSDQAILEEARRDAQQLVARDPGLAKPDHARLRRMALVRYGAVLNLGDVG